MHDGGVGFGELEQGQQTGVHVERDVVPISDEISTREGADEPEQQRAEKRS